VSANVPNAKATFVVSRAGTPIYGSVVDETGALVDARLFVGIVRPNRIKPSVVVPVVDGKFTLRMPENCTNCAYQATMGENNAYSVVPGNNNPQVKAQPDGSQLVTYLARLDTGSVVGQLRDSQTEQPVTEVRGKVTLRNGSNSYVTMIGTGGTYEFTHVADGDYDLSYELEREPGRVLAQQNYIPTPIVWQSLTVRNGVVVAQPNHTSLQSGSGDAKATAGTNFTVKTKTNCPTTQATDTTTETLRSYPSTVVCRFTDGTIRSFPCTAKSDTTAECYTPNVLPKPVCSVVPGDAAGNNAESGSTGVSLAQTVIDTIDTLLADTGDVEQVRAYLQGSQVMVPSLNATVYLARRPQKQSPPRATKIGEETQRNGATIELQDRLRDTYMFGMVRGPDGAYIRDYPVQVVAAASGNDGQTRQVETSSGYYLFEIAQSNDDWTITASMDQNGIRYRATAIINVKQMVKNGTVFVPDMTLVAVGTSTTALIQSFDHTNDSQMTFSATDESQNAPTLAATAGRSITVDIPPGAVSAETSEDVQMAIEVAEVPSTGAYQVIGEAYLITLSDRSSGRVLVEPLDRPLLVSLPYDEAALAAAGTTTARLHVATFSNDTLSWTPLLQSSIDTAAGVVRVSLDRTTDAVAIVALKPELTGEGSISKDGTSASVVISFVLQEGSSLTSTLEVPAGLTVQPNVGLAAESVAPVSVAEVRVTSPFKLSQQLDAGKTAIGTFKVDLLDEQGAIISQGLLSQPIVLNLAFDATKLPTGYLVETAGATYLNRTLSKWQAATTVQRTAIASTHQTIVATTRFAGEFVATASNQVSIYLPLISK